jgi:hypothetical protein
LVQGVLKAQPDIQFFDFDVTLASDQPQGLVEIIPPSVKAQGKSVATFNGGPFTPDRFPFLRYGRYALVETQSWDGMASAVGGAKASDFYVQDAWIRRKGSDWPRGDTNGPPLPAGYIVFDVRPEMLKESDDLLRAASDANGKVLESIRRSDAEIAAAFADIINAANGLQEQLLRQKAEVLAKRIAIKAEAGKADAEKSKAGKAALQTQFDPQWQAVVTKLPAERRDAAKKVGDEVRDRWIALYDEAAAGDTLPVADPLADADAQAALVTSQKDEIGSVAVPPTNPSAKFKVTDATVTRGAGSTKTDTLSVKLAVDGTPTAKVTAAQLTDAIKAAANTAYQNNSGDAAANPIVTVTVLNAADLSAALQ